MSAQLDLELHGRTRTLPVRFTIVDRVARRVAGSVTLKRSDFGIGTPRGGIVQVSDEVRISVDTVVPTPLAEPGTEGVDAAATIDRIPHRIAPGLPLAILGNLCAGPGIE